MAAMIAALLRRPTPDRQANRPTIVLAFTVNEECGFTGAQALCQLWQPERRGEIRISGGTISPEELFPRPPDAAIVAEPTDLNVVVAHQGMIRWRCHVAGRAAHSSRPDEGINAVYSMSRVVQVIERYHKELSATDDHPLCGRPAVCVTAIEGGIGINTVPDRATITIDRRVRPGEAPAAAYNDLVRFISEHGELGEAQLVHEPAFMQSMGLSDTDNRQLAERLASLARATADAQNTPSRRYELVGAPYGTDAAAIGASGVATVVFGPGSVRQAHTADEFIVADELMLGTEIFCAIAERGLRAK
jgi:acetylornithine deacetylase